MKLPITRIRAKNFRSLADVDVTLGPLTVLIGANGSGKTNLLSVLQFLGTTARLDLVEAVEQWGGFSHVQRQGRKLGPVTLAIEGQVTQHSSVNAPDAYELTLRSSTNGLSRSESFSFKRVAGRGRKISISGRSTVINITDEGEPGAAVRKLAGYQTTALATLPKLSDDDGGRGIRDFASMLQGIQLFDPDVDAARRPSLLRNQRLTGDASNLAGALQLLGDEDPDAWQALLSDARRCLPGLTDITFADVGGAGRAVVAQLVEAGLTAPIELRDASFGTVRLLALLCRLHDPRPPRFVAIEEIDHGLHPYALDIIADRLREASARTQIVVATHSPTFVNRLRGEEMVICERDPETGESIIPAMSRPQMARTLQGEEGRAGELWFSGVLGGVPQ